MKKYVPLFALMALPVASSAQIGYGTNTPNSSAVIDITSSNKGFLIPRMTEAQRTAISSPSDGLMVYQTDDATGTAGLYVYRIPASGTATWAKAGSGAQAIKGGTVDNTPIGAGGAETGKFTTLEATSTTTLGGAITATATAIPPVTLAGTDKLISITTGNVVQRIAVTDVFTGNGASIVTAVNAAANTSKIDNSHVATNLAITGGTITNSPISGNTGSFSTLASSSLATLASATVSGAATLSGATALDGAITASATAAPPVTLAGTDKLISITTGNIVQRVAVSDVFTGNGASIVTAVNAAANTSKIDNNHVATNLAITGGTITNSPISGNTGSFSTLASSSLATLASATVSGETILSGATALNGEVTASATAVPTGNLAANETIVTMTTAGVMQRVPQSLLATGWSKSGNAAIATDKLGTTTTNIPINLVAGNIRYGRMGGSGDNVFMGNNAGPATDISSVNVGIGSSVLANTESTTFNNTAVGNSALSANTTGLFNTAMGAKALLNNEDGNFNAALGLNSLVDNTSGSYNIGIGLGAGGGNISGSSNIFIGTSAGPAQATLTNAIAIGTLALVGASNSIVLGGINGVNNATADTKVGIGTSTPNTALHVVAASDPLQLGGLQADATPTPATISLVSQVGGVLKTVTAGALVAGNITAGTGIAKSGNTLSVDQAATMSLSNTSLTGGSVTNASALSTTGAVTGASLNTTTGGSASVGTGGLGVTGTSTLANATATSLVVTAATSGTSGVVLTKLIATTTPVAGAGAIGVTGTGEIVRVAGADITAAGTNIFSGPNTFTNAVKAKGGLYVSTKTIYGSTPSPYVVGATDYVLRMLTYAESGPVGNFVGTLTLPDPSLNDGRMLDIMNFGGAVINLTSGSPGIYDNNGIPNYTLNLNQLVRLICVAGRWQAV